MIISFISDVPNIFSCIILSSGSSGIFALIAPNNCFILERAGYTNTVKSGLQSSWSISSLYEIFFPIIVFPNLGNNVAAEPQRWPPAENPKIPILWRSTLNFVEFERTCLIARWRSIKGMGYL